MARDSANRSRNGSSASALSDIDNPKIALCLSGGGLRATFFHFGVVKALAEAGQLGNITDIISVSGGSILAGHMIHKWDCYFGPSQDLAAMEKELRTLAARGMRERIVRRWVVKGTANALITLFGYFRRRTYVQSDALRTELASILGEGTVASCYRGRTSATRPPQVHLMCTNFNSGEACCFTSDEFIIFRKPPTSMSGNGTSAPTASKTVKLAVSADTVELTYAVAASSAFPGLFPPMEITNAKLGASARDFPVTVFLSDGGIYDNLGLEHFKGLVKHGNTQADTVLVSNASGAFQWDNRNDYYGLLPRNLRTIDILMNLMIEERWERTHSDLGNPDTMGRDLKILLAEIGHTHWEDQAPPLSVQQQIQDIRTDLNRFTKAEIDLLIEHGYRAGRYQAGARPANETPANGKQPPVFPKSILPTEVGHFRVFDRLVKDAAQRRPGLFNWRDPWSVGLAIVLAAGLALLTSPLIAGLVAGKSIQRAKAAEERAEYSRKLSANLEKERAEVENKLSVTYVSLEDAQATIRNLIGKITHLEAILQTQPPAQRQANASAESVPSDTARDIGSKIAGDLASEIKQVGEKLTSISGNMVITENNSGQDQAINIDRSKYRVWIQFAGMLKREEMVAFGKRLTDEKKWTDTPGAERGGERTPNAANLTEVRYGSREDRSAAEALTKDIRDLGIVEKMNPPKRISIIPKGSLEIWISR